MQDSIYFINKLEGAGLNNEQAQILVQTLSEMMNKSFATKNDLQFALKDLGHKIDQIENKLVIKMGTMQAASIALIVTLLKFT